MRNESQSDVAEFCLRFGYRGADERSSRLTSLFRHHASARISCKSALQELKYLKMAQLQNRVIASRRPFHLSDWLVEPMLDRMSRGEEVVQLRPRAMDVLACPALQAGELASRQHLIDAVWRTEFVAEGEPTTTEHTMT